MVNIMKLITKISIGLSLAFVLIYIVIPSYIANNELKEDEENIDKSLLLNRKCLEDIGKEVCKNVGSGIKFIYINEFDYSGTFNCFDKSQIDITQEQLSNCSE